jgi:hypothetical protein
MWKKTINVFINFLKHYPTHGFHVMQHTSAGSLNLGLSKGALLDKYSQMMPKG